MVTPARGPGLRVVLLGRAGAGKSTTGNTLLGRERFQEGRATLQSVMEGGEVEGRTVTVVDTPGTNTLDKEGLREEMERALVLSSPGPQVFLLVVRVGGVTQEDVGVSRWIQETLGEQALRRTLLLVTGREKLTRRQWEEFEKQEVIRGLVRLCGGGLHAVNSKAEIHPGHVTKLLEKMEQVVEQNAGQPYTWDTYLQRRGLRGGRKGQGGGGGAEGGWRTQGGGERRGGKTGYEVEGQKQKEVEGKRNGHNVEEKRIEKEKQMRREEESRRLQEEMRREEESRKTAEKRREESRRKEEMRRREEESRRQQEEKRREEEEKRKRKEEMREEKNRKAEIKKKKAEEKQTAI
ncbi:GTPase IMAP family member 3-like [Hypomesus transpacificus]|uniref:GTPase IMAP family member 3-like n=1 Tax=Hypomesus transpacificus TaxID=137520 RepID=UPI001F07E036|nr:GTPase IMAP family member 3-like [Hypomesus transpacificus]